MQDESYHICGHRIEDTWHQIIPSNQLGSFFAGTGMDILEFTRIFYQKLKGLSLGLFFEMILRNETQLMFEEPPMDIKKILNEVSFLNSSSFK